MVARHTFNNFKDNYQLLPYNLFIDFLHLSLLTFLQAVVGFTVDNKLKEPRFEFDSEEVRYNHRFAPFGCLVTPPPVQYAQFKVCHVVLYF